MNMKSLKIRMVSGGLDTTDVEDKSALRQLAESESKGIAQTRAEESVSVEIPKYPTALVPKILTPFEFMKLVEAMSTLPEQVREDKEAIALECTKAYETLYNIWRK